MGIAKAKTQKNKYQGRRSKYTINSKRRYIEYIQNNPNATLAEIATYLQISRKTLYSYQRKYNFPSKDLIK